ncbi:ribosome biogenesis GTP-binding protein YsxC [Blattabacterium sp. (Mastotermes darwiniensis) str. MADAR]|uniref:ribosome biogenesis GTP-binding protein YihA/YsxC n=1 Tax=Blattabacterium sp. (Mastotermes darwiniensis) TaxID=39768 RepID=UPI000231DEFA|nr:ribosome biogenesis GTP-binding protein YihA/YsxC [Blattabacterium sp. (Mastotermes darwiniensis)]AER40814.1 ribosome biogenesis GTP-binding protein YsxC [Blattabacterium sp. (Mastotermes darwiniensis) str. MADAR]
MKIFSVKFKGSFVKLHQFFFHNLPEYAFSGRSNVGKSSLINFIANCKKIAKVSSHPGSTKLINFFLINHEWYLTDLPGYGYSKRKKKEKRKLILDYVSYRKNLILLFLLMDCRTVLQKIDLDFIKKLNNLKIRFCIVFTKTDKLSSRILDKKIDLCKEEIEKTSFSMPKYFKVSVKKGYGRKEIIQHIQNFNKSYKEKLIIPNS